MTDKKEQARILREAAEVLVGVDSDAFCRSDERSWFVQRLTDIAETIDPPPKWMAARDAYSKAMIRHGMDPEAQWEAVIEAANKGMVSKEELRKRAPWFSGGSGPGFSPSDYDQGVAAFLRVLESL